MKKVQMKDLLLPGTGHSEQVLSDDAPIHHLPVVKVLDDTHQKSQRHKPGRVKPASPLGRPQKLLKTASPRRH